MNQVISFVDEQEVVRLTQELVRIPSVFRPEQAGANEERVALFVADYLRKMGLQVFYEEVVPGRPNVIAFYDSGRPGKTLLFEAHTDVVTEGDRDAWSYDPFGAAISGGRIYGRGACDTKGNLAAAICAVKAIQRSKEAFAGKILLCIPCDEEGMMIGIKDFIKRGWAKGVDAAIICEPEENQLCITQKGAMRAILRTYGKMAHGAMPLTGINPNTRMARAIVALEELERREMARLGEHPMLGWPSITPTIVQAPVKGDAQINVVPDQCMTTLDIRTVPGQEHERLHEEMQAILQALAREDDKFKATLEVIEERPWTLTAMEAEVVTSVASAYREITGKAPIYNGVPGATDGTFLHKAGIPILTTGAGDRHIPHHADEYVDIDELVESTQLFALSALTFLTQPVRA
ncbi:MULTISPECIES: M20 family metallopeptidase [Brevibacillus]|jgi:acetylornithine deacetylase or succinyl-diaminopimelate desuccinylase|uniref:Probable succinyl-diaminopimelate desuccinylase n=1 Tax=Brevibacillus parabrevis TaxID=54914 RepID=A0A4Y3PR90_BREPA|nr:MULTISPECIES: M20 family metallopeptidase [Brevibacillus]MBU8712281.1 M20 family metallopeptidase [Brevibacillus parabrevis]MDH6349352.1 succinyl-diaminopimelate desuccinylase [Brevibacillus sp. 1238]MDR5001364.1 M20 family metallopeptidase [Brevibacillus parabrevis]MED2257379.1 M20 family metallopeptidase [Brevibacillus parabrevis]NRQ52378.1 M20 family metallopeptidase [Brevibacillus sp. HD1.4A]